MQTDKTSFSQDEVDLPEANDQKISMGANGFPQSAAVPILESPTRPVLHLSTSSASGESSDYTGFFPALPDVPETPSISPMSTTSSAALLIPDESSPSPRSPSRFLEKIFKGKQKKHKISS